MLAIVGEPANQARPLHASTDFDKNNVADEGKLELVYLHDANEYRLTDST
jgi:hypothetical protein